jgi:hypothetical protein
MADVSKLVDELSGLTVLEAAVLARLLKEKWKPLRVSLADIKNDLPAWPDEIIKEWLLYLANRDDTGWPPPDPLGSHPWTFILGHRPIPWWREVTWKKETVKCDPPGLSQQSRDIVVTMITEIGNGTADAETKRRFQRATQYILDHAAFPKPVIAMKIPSGLSVLDGSHRMGAFCGAQLTSDSWFEKMKKKRAALDQEVWIGTHSRGEIPLD